MAARLVLQRLSSLAHVLALQQEPEKAFITPLCLRAALAAKPGNEYKLAGLVAQETTPETNRTIGGRDAHKYS